jgi:hypothetical protein
VKNKIYFAGPSTKLEVERLRMREYANAEGFTLDLNSLKWKSADDTSYVMVLEREARIVATMRGEVLKSKTLLEKKLECPWEFPIELEGPVLLLSRAATLGRQRSSGLNLALRYRFLQMAKEHQLRFVIGTFVKGSPREKSLADMGYQMFENTLGWQRSTYRSFVPVTVAVIDMQKEGERALAYCRQHLSPELLETPFDEVPSPLRYVEDL